LPLDSKPAILIVPFVSGASQFPGLEAPGLLQWPCIVIAGAAPVKGFGQNFGHWTCQKGSNIWRINSFVALRRHELAILRIGSFHCVGQPLDRAPFGMARADFHAAARERQ
jgi:hypothetical protein